MATEMLDAGVSIVVVSHRLAHARTSTTLDRYAQAVPGRDAAAAEMLARRIHNAKQPTGPGAVAVDHPTTERVESL
jgi:integrase